MANLAARKKLSDLYARGCMVRFGPEGPRICNTPSGVFAADDPLGEDEMEMWVAPPNPYQREMALREAQAKRARALIKVKQDEDSEEYLTTKAFFADMTLDTLIDYLLLSDQETRTNEAVRRVLAEKEWENVDELRDALRQFDEDENLDTEDPEYKAVMEADARYTKQVQEAALEILESSRASYELLSRDQLEAKGMEKRGEIVGSQVFVNEYESQMKYYSAREPEKHDVLFFESAKELQQQDEIIQGAIGEAVAKFVRDGAEAKN